MYTSIVKHVSSPSITFRTSRKSELPHLLTNVYRTNSKLQCSDSINNLVVTIAHDSNALNVLDTMTDKQCYILESVANYALFADVKVFVVKVMIFVMLLTFICRK